MLFSHTIAAARTNAGTVISRVMRARAADRCLCLVVWYTPPPSPSTDYEMFDSQRYSTLHGHVDDLLSILEHFNQQQRKERTEQQVRLRGEEEGGRSMHCNDHCTSPLNTTK